MAAAFSLEGVAPQDRAWPAQRLAKRVAIRPQLLRKTLGHNHHAGVRAPFCCHEGASVNEIDPERAEKLRETNLARRRRFLPCALPTPVAYRKPDRQRCRNRGDYRVSRDRVDDLLAQSLVDHRNDRRVGRPACQIGTAAQALRRKAPEEISRSPQAVTWTWISTLRACLQRACA